MPPNLTSASPDPQSWSFHDLCLVDCLYQFAAKSVHPFSKHLVHKFGLFGRSVTLTFDLLTPRVERFMPFPCGLFVPIGIKIGSFTFEISCWQVCWRTNGRTGRKHYAYAWRRHENWSSEVEMYWRRPRASRGHWREELCRRRTASCGTAAEMDHPHRRRRCMWRSHHALVHSVIGHRVGCGSNFCCAMQCISAAYVVMRCLSVCLSVSYVRGLCRNG